MNKDLRRGFVLLAATTSSGLLLSKLSHAQPPRAKKTEENEEDVSPAEELMREHGVLKRVLLIYREAISRIDGGRDLPADALVDSAKLIRAFVEDYHEKLEQDYLFPRFKKAGKLTD